MNLMSALLAVWCQRITYLTTTKKFVIININTTPSFKESFECVREWACVWSELSDLFGGINKSRAYMRTPIYQIEINKADYRKEIKPSRLRCTHSPTTQQRWPNMVLISQVIFSSRTHRHTHTNTDAWSIRFFLYFNFCFRNQFAFEVKQRNNNNKQLTVARKSFGFPAYARSVWKENSIVRLRSFKWFESSASGKVRITQDVIYLQKHGFIHQHTHIV